MEKGAYVNEITNNSRVGGLFLIAEASSGTSRTGDPYWSLALVDKTGSIEAKIWHPLSSSIANIEKGGIALISGRAKPYREKIQLVLDAFSPLPEEETRTLDPAVFMPSAPVSADDMFTELKRACLEEFVYPPWRKFILALLNDEKIVAPLKTFPAAKRMHHAYAGGLLEHTLSVFNLCRSLADRYPQLDRQTLLAGALCHDIGKIREFSGGFANDYTDVGRLSGHIILGLELIGPFLQKSGLDDKLKDHLSHLVLSHHGQYEYGASRLPQTAEAFVLHYADNLDAKLAQFRDLFDDAAPEEWSDYQKGMERYLYNPFRTPEKPKTEKISAECLSLLKE
ncbi:MAG: CRISPR-associated endonuclease Cas3'' [Desulfovibrio sp.]|nr:CRISPR-associated endonuclease Cas3'' [Desulfovibrio sp.]